MDPPAPVRRRGVAGIVLPSPLRAPRHERGHRARRHQERQHPLRRGGRRQARGLWHGAAHGGRPPAHDDAGRVEGLPGSPLRHARAPGTDVGRVLLRRGAARTANGGARVPADAALAQLGRPLLLGGGRAARDPRRLAGRAFCLDEGLGRRRAAVHPGRRRQAHDAGTVHRAARHVGVVRERAPGRRRGVPRRVPRREPHHIIKTLRARGFV